MRSAEGKVKAVNYLLPHIQRVPSRIVRDELAQEIAQKLGIDSAVLRQELKHAVTNRSSATLKAPAEAQITDAEKILIRALVSATEMQTARNIFPLATAPKKSSIPRGKPVLLFKGSACTWIGHRSIDRIYIDQRAQNSRCDGIATG